MSKSRNSNRLAKKIHHQTSLTLATATRLAKQADVYLGTPVADASDPDQRRLEAHVAHVLASSFQDRQLNGALLGVLAAQEESQYLALTLEPVMANEILSELLPRFDHFYGGIRGVPALRVRQTHERVVLLDALSSARITLTRADGGPMLLPSARDGEALLWKRVPLGLSREEREEAEEWIDSRSIKKLRVRDVLLSRVLRRPGLVNRAAQPHGFANCYTHHSGDLVIEWCCGDTAGAFCANLAAHGFLDGLPRQKALELTSPRSARLGDSTLILNRHDSCLYGSGATEIVEYIRERYES
ncbi:hypothetical protein [Streptomyces sp. NPDC045470]|uniref:hypothetical protein n=1 Tax=unclassified Streptomyces TaxID=2593676 RepID=UPI00340A4C00